MHQNRAVHIITASRRLSRGGRPHFTASTLPVLGFPGVLLTVCIVLAGVIVLIFQCLCSVILDASFMGLVFAKISRPQVVLSLAFAFRSHIPCSQPFSRTSSCQKYSDTCGGRLCRGRVRSRPRGSCEANFQNLGVWVFQVWGSASAAQGCSTQRKTKQSPHRFEQALTARKTQPAEPCLDSVTPSLEP